MQKAHAQKYIVLVFLKALNLIAFLFAENKR